MRLRGKFDATARARAGITGIREEMWRKIEDANAQLDMMTVTRYYEMIAKDEGVTVDEAAKMCVDVPKYSMGLKMASPAVVMMLRSKKGKQVFESWLTPEELEEWAQVKDMNFRQMMRKEKKKQKG